MRKFLPVLILLTLSLPTVVLAQTLPQLDLITTLDMIANLIFMVLLAVSLIFLVWAAVLFVTAAGKVEQVEQARHIMLYVVIGLVVAALAWGIREFLRSQLGF